MPGLLGSLSPMLVSVFSSHAVHAYARSIFHRVRALGGQTLCCCGDVDEQRRAYFRVYVSRDFKRERKMKLIFTV
jgi:hypothetical protein